MLDHIDRSNPVPLYWQLAELIKSQIATGHYQPGDRIPAEYWLASTYNVSRVTVRKAIQLLIGNNTLDRSRGESPTVSFPRLSRQTNRLTSLSESLIEMGHVPGSRILCCEKGSASLRAAYYLGMEIGDPVFHLMRLRLADDSPLAIHNCFYPYAICGKALTSSFHGESVYHFLEANGFSLSHATQIVSARNATDTEASLLAIPSGSALLHIERVSYTNTGKAIEYSEMLYNPTRYDLRMELDR
ncbi:MAG: GntR family transcriptional regulator [Clostridia bacterium]